MKKLIALALAAVMVFTLMAVSLAEEMYISVISKGEQHAFWQAVKKGCEDAAKAQGVNMFYYGPPSEADIQQQVDALNSEMAKNPKAICLAALDTQAVLGQLTEAKEKGIPVVGFDSGVPGAPEGSIVSTVATNNKAAAGMAAEKLMEVPELVEAMKAATPENPIVIGCLSQDVTSMSVSYRTEGFVEKMKELASAHGTVSVEGIEKFANKAEGASIIIHVEVGATAQSADLVNAANALLNMKNLAAVFCSNEGVANALLAATADGSELAEGGRYEKLIVAGFDAGSSQKNAVRQKWFIGAVSQNPYKMGYLAVETAVKAAKGETVEDADTGAVWYNSENIDNEDVAMLVYD